MTFNTGNPIGSTDARDRSDNSENLDLAVNSLSQTFVDRLGVTRDTLEGIYQKSAYYRAGTFDTGYTLTNNRQTLAYGNIEYSWSGAFPKVVPAGSTPATAGGVGASAWSDKTDLTLRSELSSNNGADLIPSLSDVYVAFDLDTTGATDETLTIASLFTKYPIIKLPRGIIKANISIPNDCCLLGSGKRKWNGASWEGNGTLIIGNVDTSNKKRVSGGNFSVDNYDSAGNTITGLGPSTETIYFRNVSTRANNHNYLFEQNGTDPVGGSGGTIILEDCEASSGPNGFAIKMKNVTLIRCDSSRSTVQAYVCASDNINGATTYSRAQDVTFIDCTGSGNKTTLRCYSRDHFSLTNANGVYPASNIKWVRGKLFGCSEHAVHIGDFYEPIPTITHINCEDVSILDADASYNTLRAVLITLGTRITVKNNRMGGNGVNVNIDFDDYGSRCIDLDITDNRYFGAVLGKESGVYTLGSGQTLINASHGMKMFKTANASANIISGIIGGKSGQSITLSIDDEFTSCVVGEKVVAGKGVVATYDYDSITGTWLCTEDRTGNERVIGYSPYLILDFSAGVTSGVYVGLTSTTVAVGLYAPPASHAGRLYTARLSPANTGDKGISGWDTSRFKFSTTVPAPSVIAYGTTQLITFFWDGARMIATSSVNVSS